MSVSVVFGALLLAVGVWVVAFPRTAPPAEQVASADQSSSVTTGAVAPPVGPAHCVAQSAKQYEPEQLVLTVYPTHWYPMGAMLAPQSQDGGPRDFRTHQCFARTPEGALYAIATRVAVEAQTAGVSGKQFSGYQWLSYSPDLVMLSLAASPVSGGTGKAALARTFSATWSGNDWHPAVIDTPPAALDGLRTFTPWGGS